MTNPMHALTVACLVGVASGADAAIWGMYKDATHEGFTWLRFFRSIALGAVVAMGIERLLWLDVSLAGSLLMLFGLAYALERVLVETWKTFLRVEDQSKYAIPMQFAIRGVPVRSRALRVVAGSVYVGTLSGSVVLLSRLPIAHDSWPLAGLIGFLAGLVVAIGGAWKDAPIEGFEGFKFFRSPLLTTAFAVLLFPLTSHALLAGLASIGFERAASENYKTFFFPARPRGKFAGKPVKFPAMMRTRRNFVPAYIAIRILLAWCIMQAFVEPSACRPSTSPCVRVSVQSLPVRQP